MTKTNEQAGKLSLKRAVKDKTELEGGAAGMRRAMKDKTEPLAQSIVYILCRSFTRNL
ncbi:hypothetical protein [Bacillus sp. T33-2]|uniref:hypothetical protein n=1 Tax=Bacillus sp. T33-2 TaxID=2054168 RepID=UPI0015E0F6C1|nr:hypothetical protein [Bacillus sp. T33-2]